MWPETESEISINGRSLLFIFQMPTMNDRCLFTFSGLPLVVAQFPHQWLYIVLFVRLLRPLLHDET